MALIKQIKVLGPTGQDTGEVAEYHTIHTDFADKRSGFVNVALAAYLTEKAYRAGMAATMVVSHQYTVDPAALTTGDRYAALYALIKQHDPDFADAVDC